VLIRKSVAIKRKTRARHKIRFFTKSLGEKKRTKKRGESREGRA